MWRSSNAVPRHLSPIDWGRRDAYLMKISQPRIKALSLDCHERHSAP